MINKKNPTSTAGQNSRLRQISVLKIRVFPVNVSGPVPLILILNGEYLNRDSKTAEVTSEQILVLWGVSSEHVKSDQPNILYHSCYYT